MQIDWEKPLECKSFAGHTVDFIGFTPDGFDAVVQSQRGTLYKANRLTGFVVSGTCRIQNKKEDWEVAWELYNTPSYYYKNEEDWFKEVFELGRTWHENQKKA